MRIIARSVISALMYKLACILGFCRKRELGRQLGKNCLGSAPYSIY